MKKFRLHVRKPNSYNLGDWDIQSDAILGRLKEYGIYPEDESYCGWSLGKILNELEIKDFAMWTAGADWPSVVEKVKGLTLIGNGNCPVCGSNDIAGEDYCECLSCGNTWHEKQDAELSLLNFHNYNG